MPGISTTLSRHSFLPLLESIGQGMKQTFHHQSNSDSSNTIVCVCAYFHVLDSRNDSGRNHKLMNQQSSSNSGRLGASAFLELSHGVGEIQFQMSLTRSSFLMLVPSNSKWKTIQILFTGMP